MEGDFSPVQYLFLALSIRDHIEVIDRRKLMRKTWCALSLVCLLVAVTMGCGKKTAATDSAASANEVSQFHAAIQDGDAEIVRRLIQAKPYLVNAKNDRGETPLKVAKQKGNEEVADVISKAGGKE
jgi:hypothetical protein